MTDSPKIHAKHVDIQVNWMVSVGTEDRERSIEDFVQDIEKAIQEVAGAKRVLVQRPYYILDGKVCLVEDYDPATQNFKEGATPPPWAGGPTHDERRRADQAAAHAALDEEDPPPSGRKVRSDKGKPRKRAVPTDEQKAKVKEAAEDLKGALS